MGIDKKSLDMEMYARGISYIHMYKCKSEKCDLEYSVFSWYGDWPQQCTPFCPECGAQNSIRLNSIEVKRKIHDIVRSTRWE